MDVYSFESGDARRARYARMAIAAAVAAARAPLPEVRAAYLLIAESWSNLAKRDEETVRVATDEEKASAASTVNEEPADFGADFDY